MLNEFQVELSADKSLNPNHVPHYIRWVRDCYNFFRQQPNVRLPLEQTRLFLSHLEKSRERWQVRQAEQALRRFDFFLTMKSSPAPAEADHDAWGDIIAQTRDVLRLKQLALNTEKTYLSWLRQFQQ